jgi:hypothetical protein
MNEMIFSGIECSGQRLLNGGKVVFVQYAISLPP